jgi:hypothetical protein
VHINQLALFRHGFLRQIPDGKGLDTMLWLVFEWGSKGQGVEHGRELYHGNWLM